MKIKRPQSKIMSALFVAAFTLHACMTVSYVGDRVIGHLSEKVSGLNGEERAKQQIIAKCREVGADGVIILGFEYGGAKETEEYQKAQAIKFTE